MEIVSDVHVVEREFKRWQDALLENATPRGKRKWKVEGTGLFLKLEVPRRKKKSLLNASLTKSPLFDNAIVKINLPTDPDTPNGLSAVGRSPDGKFFLLRQGMLQTNAISDKVLGFEFPLLAATEPDLVMPPTDKVGRYWFRVCRLDQSAQQIRRETERFAELCLLVRYRKAADPALGAGFWSSALEGGLKLQMHLGRERSRKLVKAKKAEVLQAGGKLCCEACDFEFAPKYGARGEGFIEVHHNVKPLHKYDGSEITDLSDLALICSNCHRIAHVTPEWLTVEQVRRLISDQARKESGQ